MGGLHSGALPGWTAPSGHACSSTIANGIALNAEYQFQQQQTLDAYDL